MSKSYFKRSNTFAGMLYDLYFPKYFEVTWKIFRHNNTFSWMLYDLYFQKYSEFSLTIFCHYNVLSQSIHSLECFMIYIFRNILSSVFIIFWSHQYIRWNALWFIFQKYSKFSLTIFCHFNVLSQAIHSLECFMIYIFRNILSLVFIMFWSHQYIRWNALWLIFQKYYKFSLTIFCHYNVLSQSIHSLECFMI